MRDRIAALLIFAGLGGYLYQSTDAPPTPVPNKPTPVCPCPQPCPCPAPCPGPNCPGPRPAPVPVPAPSPPCPGPCPSQPTEAAPVGAISEGGKVSPDGAEEITCDLPQSEKKKNVGGRDGAGLCVFTSIEYSARYQNERRLVDFQQKMRAELGGGWPQKVDRMIEKYAPGTPYIQHTGGDVEFLRAAFRSGRMPAVTYCGRDVHYRGNVAHMVSLAHLSDRWAVVTDNNFPGDSQFVWLSPAEFRDRWMGNSGGWAVVLLSPPPPPVPRN